jgi:hypothetical protein
MVSKNMLQREIPGPKNDRVTADSRKFQSEELHNLYSLLNITRMVKTRRMGWEGHAMHTGETSQMHTNNKLRGLSPQANYTD